MSLIQAINKVAQGSTITSCTGRTYTYDMLQPEWAGEHYASFRTCGMTEVEKKGDWIVGSKE